MLKTILATRRQEITAMTPLDRHRSRPVRNMMAALRCRPFICEVKRRSPSRGDFPPVDPATRARIYESAGAGAVSVLTEPTHFGGSYGDLAAVAAACRLPVLCKDFILSEIQVENAYRAGADAVLLIAAALGDDELATLAESAASRGMAVLVEIHDGPELERALALNPELVGVNARNLATMTIDLDHAVGLLERIPEPVCRVAESGLHTARDVARMRAAGADAFLVGTALMAAPDPAAALAELAAGLTQTEESPCS